MIEINKIEFEEKVYALYFDVKNTPKGLSFISDDKDFIQVGMWNYDAKKILPAHYHCEFKRESTRTCESVYVVKGKVRCNIYTKTGSHIDSFDLNEGEMAIQLYGVHEYEILEEALVIENKNGPYFGPEKDRKRIDVKKN